MTLKTLESKLGKSVKKNQISIGFDSSQHSTGICILKTTEKTIKVVQTANLKVHKGITRKDAIDVFIDLLDDFKNKIAGKYKFDEARVENVYIGLNPSTGIYLARVGVLVYDRFKRLSKNIDFCSPVHARSVIGFKKSSKSIKGNALKKEIITYINKLLGTKIEQEDTVEAAGLALVGLVE
jgi:Holliday junction resolvasome RuvABC endonuclease subunit